MSTAHSNNSIIDRSSQLLIDHLHAEVDMRYTTFNLQFTLNAVFIFASVAGSMEYVVNRAQLRGVRDRNADVMYRKFN